VVTVRTYWAWETTATLCLLGSAPGAGAPMGEERGGGIGLTWSDWKKKMSVKRIPKAIVVIAGGMLTRPDIMLYRS